MPPLRGATIHAHTVHGTHVQAHATLYPQPQLQRAQQILAGRELARKQREQAWRLRGVAEDSTCDLQVSSSIEEGAGLRNAQQK